MNGLVNILNNIQGVLSNPNILLTRIGLPADALQNPQLAIQQLMNSGRMSQEQFNQFYQTAQQIQNMPQFKQMFK